MAFFAVLFMFAMSAPVVSAAPGDNGNGGGGGKPTEPPGKPDNPGKPDQPGKHDSHIMQPHMQGKTCTQPEHTQYRQGVMS